MSALRVLLWEFYFESFALRVFAMRFCVVRWFYQDVSSPLIPDPIIPETIGANVLLHWASSLFPLNMDGLIHGAVGGLHYSLRQRGMRVDGLT